MLTATCYARKSRWRHKTKCRYQQLEASTLSSQNIACRVQGPGCQHPSLPRASPLSHTGLRNLVEAEQHHLAVKPRQKICENAAGMLLTISHSWNRRSVKGLAREKPNFRQRLPRRSMGAEQHSPRVPHACRAGAAVDVALAAPLTRAPAHSGSTARIPKSPATQPRPTLLFTTTTRLLPLLLLDRAALNLPRIHLPLWQSDCNQPPSNTASLCRPLCFNA